MVELESEEREVLDAYSQDRLERVHLTRDEIERYREAARAVGRKDRRINIRLSSPSANSLVRVC